MALVCSFIVVFCALFSSIMGANGRTMPTAAVIGYLRKYGYLTEDDINRSEFAIRRNGIASLGLTKFQKKMGIRPSGRLDAVTERLLRSPRCGEQDIHPHNTEVDSLIEKIAEKGVLKYHVKEWSDHMPLTIQNQTLHYMFKTWANDWAVKVVWSKIDPDVKIVFRPGKKRRNGGKDSLTDELTEVKMENNVYTIYFYSTAAEHLNTFTRTSQHALGHVFGRQHSDLHSIMSPIVREDDGRNCEISLSGAFSHLTIGKSFLLRNNLVWTIRDNNPDARFSVVYPPKKISEVFTGIPDNIDDAVSYSKNYQSYVFKGSLYWRFTANKKTVDPGFPYQISQGWHGVPDNIDAVFTPKGLANTYFLKGNLVYKYDHDKESVMEGYPKKIKEEFPKLPESNFDAAFHYYWDDMVYFFKGLYFWKMNDTSITGPFITKYEWKDLCIPKDMIF